jgi:hypothetical protein
MAGNGGATTPGSVHPLLPKSLSRKDLRQHEATAADYEQFERTVASQPYTADRTDY